MKGEKGRGWQGRIGRKRKGKFEGLEWERYRCGREREMREERKGKENEGRGKVKGKGCAHS